MIRGHYVCLGYSREERAGRFIVSTFECATCHRIQRTIWDAPRWYHYLIDRFVRPPLVSDADVYAGPIDESRPISRSGSTTGNSASAK